MINYATWCAIRESSSRHLTSTQVAQELHLDARTVHSWINRPFESRRKHKRIGKLDVYKERMEQWINTGSQSTYQIFHRLRDEGFTGGFTIVKDHAAQFHQRPWIDSFLPYIRESIDKSQDFTTSRLTAMLNDRNDVGINERILDHNTKAAISGGPTVKIAPLPSGAQFLNVIESVFSGMSRAIIHHSNYSSIDTAKVAIDRYFVERNDHFLQHPHRAGNKIWGKEREPASFSDAGNFKDPRYR